VTARQRSPQAWERLGALLRERREELDPRFFNRETFASERKINYKLCADIEKHERENFSPTTLQDKVAPAYAVTYESLWDALDGGDLVALPGTPPHRPRARPARETVPSPPSADGGWLPPLGADAIARARPYADMIFMARSDWRAGYAAAHPGIAVSDIPEPPGGELFPDSDDDARTWDGRAAVLSVQERVWLIAALRARESTARQRATETG
jgi:hypothetical protein